MFARRFCLVFIVSIVFASVAPAQFKLDLQACEDLKITSNNIGINTVETATCIKPTKSFSPKGTLRNVHIVATFTPVPSDYQQNIGETNRRYATVGDQLRLPAGVYSVYIIAWGKRETMEHRGNLTEYFAKMTLTVK